MLAFLLKSSSVRLVAIIEAISKPHYYPLVYRRLSLRALKLTYDLLKKATGFLFHRLFITHSPVEDVHQIR
jgi:hypothetical protein